MGRWKRKHYRKKLQKESESTTRTTSMSTSLSDCCGKNEQCSSNTKSDADCQNDNNTHRAEGMAVSSSSLPPSIPGWTWKERIMIYRYLEQYKAGCECFYAGIEPRTTICFHDTQAMTIGLVEFPLLSATVFRQPYLCLPSSITNKNRRMIHECCVETALFHTTTGEYTSKHRIMAISIYANGFDTLSNILPSKHSLIVMPTNVLNAGNNNDADSTNTKFYHPPVYKFRPWHARKDRKLLLDSSISMPPHQPCGTTNESSNRSSTPVVSNTVASSVWRSADSRGKRMVESLIDHPEKCIRDELDVIDFAYWDKVTLSDLSISLYSSGHSTGTSSNGPINSSEWTLVDSGEKMRKLISDLWASNPTEIGFDLEALNSSKYAQLTCLLQITSNAGHDYIIDTLAPDVWDMIGIGLAPFFSNPDIVKVGHSIGGLDVRSLHRDFGIFVVNAFDTYEAGKVLGLPALGLASLCAHYGLQDSDHYKQLKAEYQATDWRRRPLTKPMLEYGRHDGKSFSKSRIRYTWLPDKMLVPF